jgi:hypothetical protein
LDKFNKQFWRDDQESNEKADTILAIVNALPNVLDSLSGILGNIKTRNVTPTCTTTQVDYIEEEPVREYRPRKPKYNNRNTGGMPKRKVRTMDRLWEIYWDTHEHNTSGEWYNGTYYSPSEIDMLEFRGSDLVNDAIKAVREKQKREIIWELLNE